MIFHGSKQSKWESWLEVFRFDFWLSVIWIVIDTDEQASGGGVEGGGLIGLVFAGVDNLSEVAWRGGMAENLVKFSPPFKKYLQKHQVDENFVGTIQN